MQEEKQENKQTETSAKAANDFLNTTDFKVQLTYKFTDPETKITFYCVLEQSETEKENSQKFYALTKDERAAKQYDFNRDRLISLTSAAPDGLPGFDKFNAAPNCEVKLVKQFLAEYFATETPIKKMVLSDALDRYASISKPIEFFR